MSGHAYYNEHDRKAAAWLRELIWCRDQRWRPIEPGSEPLVNGTPARVGQLRGYGNAIVASCVAEVIRAVM